jgi:signal peptidase I
MNIYDENNNEWFTKDRSETISNRVVRLLGDTITVENPGLGLNIYRNTFSTEDANRYINILESNLSQNKTYKWSDATVTNSPNPIKKARDCVDFKYKQENLGPRNENNAELLDLHQEIYEKLKLCIDDYARYWGINVVYYEAFNFVKYEGEGTHFNIHADHGPAYNCTVSAVIYINDDYEGGEIKFPRLDNYVHTPRVGDIAVFPSNYIYEHASLPMKSGTKYCVVVMTDINKLGHPDSQ